MSGVDTHEYLTVPELADLLRIKERKVYDLAASGDVPCSRATGKLLFPAREVRQWIKRAETGSVETHSRPAIILGSHDPLLDWAVRQSGCGLPTFFDGSSDGLARFCAGEGIAAGLHLYDADTSQWNAPAVASEAAGENAVLLRFARRRRGLVLRTDGPEVRGLADLAGKTVVRRQAASGADALFGTLAEEAGLSTDAISFSEVARTEDDAVQMVSGGEADVAFGLESSARTFGLDFVPVVEEQFDLLVDRRAWFDVPLRALFEFFQSRAFRDRAARYGGYDISEIGAVVWNA